jgi:hypothetical protein
MPVSPEKALHSKAKVTTLRRVYSSPKFKTGQKTVLFRKNIFPRSHLLNGITGSGSSGTGSVILRA